MDTNLALDFYEEIVSYRDYLVDVFMDDLGLFLNVKSGCRLRDLQDLQKDLAIIDDYQQVIEVMAQLGELESREKVQTLNKEYKNLRYCVVDLRNTNLERGA